VRLRRAQHRSALRDRRDVNNATIKPASAHDAQPSLLKAEGVAKEGSVIIDNLPPVAPMRAQVRNFEIDPIRLPGYVTDDNVRQVQVPVRHAAFVYRRHRVLKGPSVPCGLGQG
jgi:hypothetical protein